LKVVTEDHFEFAALLWCHGAITCPLFRRRGRAGRLFLGFSA
jgi:hypothetical protein